MAEVRTDFYNQPRGPNAFEQFGQAASAANAMEQNKLLKGQQEQQAIAIDRDKLALAASQLGQFRSMLAPLINKSDLSTQDVNDIAVKAVQHKLSTPQQVITELSKFPRNGTAQEKLGYVRNLYTQTLDHEKQIGMMLGPVQGVGTGGGTSLMQVPGMPGQPARQVGGVANTLAPGTQVYNPANRQQEFITTGEPGAFTPAPGGGRTGGGGAPPRGAGVGAAPAAGGRLPAAAPMGEQTAADQAAAGAGSVLARAYEQSSQFQNQIFPLEQAIDALGRLGKTGTGPGTDTVNQIKSFAQSMGVPAIDDKKISDYDKSKKYLVDYVNRTGNSGTNDKLVAAFAGNASVNISNAAAFDVAKAALALRRMEEAATRAWDASGLPEKDASKFFSRWQRNSDPRVFGFDLMNDKQRKAVVEALPAGKREKFMLDVQDAEQMGLLRPPALLPPTLPKGK